MKLPDKLPTNMTEAKAMFKELSDQVVEKVSELCNSLGKHAEPTEKKAENVAAAPPVAEEKKVEPEKPAAKDSETPPQA